MRTVSANVQTAIAAQSRQMQVRATFTKMRSYFTSLDYNNPPSTGLSLPLPAEDSQDFTRHASNISRSGSYTYTVFRNETVLAGLRNDSSTVNNILYSGQKVLCAGRPGVLGDTIYWKNIGPNTQIYTGTVTWGSWSTTRAQVVDLGAGYENVQGALHPLNSTMVAYVYISGAGIGVNIYHNSAGWHLESSMPVKMMFPTMNLNQATLWINYTAAVNLGGSTYPTIIYVTSPEDGSVLGVMYDPTTGIWSDPWIALQSDLSEFRCSNAFYYNSKVLLLGQLSRNDKEIKHNPVPMILTSTDGKYLNINQFMLVSKFGWRFMGSLSGDVMYFGDMNRIASVTLGAAHYNANATSTTVTGALSFTGTSTIGGAEAQLTLPAADESLITNSTIVRLNRCKIEIGYMTSTGSQEYTQYDTYIIGNKQTVYADGVRQLVLSLVQESFWLLGTQTPPYYTEIIGKSGTVDTLKSYENMYVSGGAAKSYTSFSMDLWGAEKWAPDSTYTEIDILTGGGGPNIMYHTAGGLESFRSADILEHLGCGDYPEITQKAVEISLYGYSRNKTGQTAHVPVLWAMGVFIERNGEEMYVPCTLKSTYTGRWDRSYPTEVLTYDDPVVFITGTDQAGAGMEIGDKLKRFAFMVSGANDCAWRIERVHISSGVVLGYDESTWQAMDIVEGAGNTVGGYKIPGYGRYIMLSTKPYSAFGSIASATFERSMGASPSSGTSAVSGVGIVILAEDANNCIIVRHQVSHSDGDANRIRIVKVRDGKETYLAKSTSAYTSTEMRLIVVHKGNLIKCYVVAPDAWLINEAVSYTWVATEGAMATAKEESLHVGIYMEKSPSNFKCNSFNYKKSANIPVLQGDSLTGFNAMAASGYVVVDGVKYKYASKTGTTYWRGPYRYVTSYTKGSYDNGHNGYPAGNYYDIAWFYWYSNSTEWQRYNGYILSSDTGWSTVISVCDFRPPLNDTWDTGPTNRSTYSSGNVNEALETMDMSTKMYIGPGLKGVEISNKTEDMWHSWGTKVYQYATEEYICRNFTAFNSNNEMTVKEIINIVCKSVGASATFSGDFYDDSISLSAGTPYQIY